MPTRILFSPLVVATQRKQQVRPLKTIALHCEKSQNYAETVPFYKKLGKIGWKLGEITVFYAVFIFQSIMGNSVTEGVQERKIPTKIYENAIL